MYITGIRITELKQIRLIHIFDFLEGKPFHITPGKSKNPVKQVYESSSPSHKILTKNLLEDLYELKTTNDLKKFLVPYSRQHLNRV